MEDLIEEQLLQISTYKKWLKHLYEECKVHIKLEQKINPEIMVGLVQQCVDEIETIRDQRK